ncbi:MAG: hypothetical protein Q9162_002983 [Coniocarpon cinnabarinum]
MSNTTTYPAEVHTFHSGSPHPAPHCKTFQSLDPSNAKSLATVHTSTSSQIDAAVSSAQSAFSGWSRTPALQRGRILVKAAALLRERNDALAKTETLDTGKPWSETSTVDVATGADVLEYYGHYVASGGLDGECTKLREDAWVYTRNEPLGVCAGIGAWNYPLQIACWKSAPCLAAGNCMVYKPSEVTPLHAQAYAEILLEAGLPRGVFNVVYGNGPDVGAPLAKDLDIAKVSFTGQVSTGQKVASSAAEGMKSVTMELGGKSPIVICPDANLEDAVDIAMVANFFSTGQVCTNGTRVFVPDTLKADFESLLVRKCKEGIRMGPPFDPNTNLGPLVSKMQLEKVNGYIDHGKMFDNAKVLYDGHAQDPSLLPTDLRSGYWCPPFVFTDCTDRMRIARDEIFGPVMCILPYSTSSTPSLETAELYPFPSHPYLSDVLRRANDTPMGLAAGVVSSDLTLAHRVVQHLEAGITWINTWGESPAEMPVGGWKLSGVGVENGKKGIEAYTRNKSSLVQMGGGACAGVFAKVEGAG